jgi:ribA/ribD-fused uncharacterized protein
MYSIKTIPFALCVVAAIMISMPVATMQQKATVQDWNDLIQAINAGNLEAVKKIVPSKIGLDAKTLFQARTLISVARFEKQPTIVEYLYQEKMKELKANNVKEIGIRDPSVWFSTEFANDYVGKPITLDGRDWPTVEHYYQAMKLKPEFQEKEIPILISLSANLLSSKMRDESYKTKMRSDWKNVSRSFMKKAVLAKFSQDEHLKNILVMTAPLPLLSKPNIDDYWGVGKNEKGRNEFGKVLMEVRSQLQPLSWLGWLTRGALVAATAVAGYAALRYWKKPAATK